MKEHKIMQHPLGISSVEIDNAISYARKAKSKKSEALFFNKAAERLAEDIKTALSLINCQ